jgi:hypothetical protein
MVLTIGPGGCGFTFLNWSLLYLRGDVQYVTLSGEVTPVPENPLRALTAHNFKKDHLKVEDSSDWIEHATQSSVIYCVPGSRRHLENLMGMPSKKLLFDAGAYSKQTMHRAFMANANVGIAPLLEKLNLKFDNTITMQVIYDVSHQFVSYYDIPKDRADVMAVSFEDMFINFSERIVDIMRFCEFEIVTSRWEHWLTMYSTWRENNTKFLEPPKVVEMDTEQYAIKKQILKEIIEWRNSTNGL